MHGLPPPTASASASPHPLFDSDWYQEQNQDVDFRRILPFIHYITCGWRSGRSPHPLFSVTHYLSTNPEVARSQLEPLSHFVSAGWKELRNPHPLFDVRCYLEQFSQFSELSIDPLTHYVTVGWREGRRPSELFDPTWYLSRYGDVELSGCEPLAHYVRAGAREGRFPTPAAALAAGEPPRALRLREDLGSHSLRMISISDCETQVTLSNARESPQTESIGVFVHLFYESLAEEIASYLARIHSSKHIYVSTDSLTKAARIRISFSRYGLSDDTDIEVFPNRGLDIGPLLVGLADKIRRHEIGVKIHGKRSNHNPPEFGNKWRSYLLEELLGTPKRIASILAAFEVDPSLGILMPRHWPALDNWIGVGNNGPQMADLLSRAGLAFSPAQKIEYPSGSMFWFRREALSPLLDLNLSWVDFNSTSTQRDATLAHAVERSFLFFSSLAGKKWSFLPKTVNTFEISRSEALHAIKGSNEFDAKYYKSTYPDISQAGVDPLEHYLDYGFREGRDPSPHFHTKYYTRITRAEYGADVCPLAHYALVGKSRGLPTQRSTKVTATVRVDNIYASYVRAERNPEYVPEAHPIIRRTDIKLIAFYFPQFHPFDENNRFWGKGFTEWTNTTKAIPMFAGHYQPRLPGELGFYDTRVKDVLARQIELARQYGIYGFCLHHYFFSGKAVMRAPFNLLMANPDLNIPFCLHWANEPWTVRWDGLSLQTGMLLDQRHEPKDDIAFFEDIRPAVSDPRYITINGRPLLIIYRPGLFPNIRATSERWRECFRRAGLQDPYLAVMQTSFEGAVDPAKYGFDAAIEYPPHNFPLSDVSRQVELYDQGFEGNIFDYEHIVDSALSRQPTSYTQFRGIIPEWDCTPRRTNPDLFINCGPHHYQRWLEGLCTDSERRHSPSERFIFVNAWNEWAEGAYLEPDRRYGYGYLDATATALNAYRTGKLDSFKQRILLGTHLFYTDMLDEFVDKFKNVEGSFDLVVTTPHDKVKEVRENLVRALAKHVLTAAVIGVDDIGRDFAPLIFEFLPRAKHYDICCWVHSKKSAYEPSYANWRGYLLRNLMGTPERVAAIIDAFSRDSKLGLVYPKPFVEIAGKVEWGSNFKLASELLAKLGITVDEKDQPRFPTAAMFWFRPRALEGLVKLDLTRDDFVRYADGPRDPKTNSVIDGTISHALERMITYVAEASGYRAQEFVFEQ
jgi:lipopolysaccharide biosynthesis protein